jgi:stage V sporulation protein R
MYPEEMELINKAAEEMEIIAQDLGLTLLPQEFEWVTDRQILALIAKMGSRFKYPHWSFGKEYSKLSRQKETFKDAFEAYELVINSYPCVAYLVENAIPSIVSLVIAHVYGHNDFFKNNIAFRDSNRRSLLYLRAKNQERIKELEQKFGRENVEAVLDAARTIMYHKIDINPSSLTWLEFFAPNPRLEDWERELILIVNEEAKEELRYMKTKTMNEGWASFWEMEIIYRSNILPYFMKDQAAIFHSELVSPPLKPTMGFNPYNLGMLIFRKIMDRFGMEKLFSVRSEETDDTFFENYLDQEIGAEANLAFFDFDQKGKIEKVIFASEADDAQWQTIKNSVISFLPINQIPTVVFQEVERGEILKMRHIFDGRNLDLDETKKVISQIAKYLWKGSVWIFTEAIQDSNRSYIALRANSAGEIC